MKALFFLTFQSGEDAEQESLQATKKLQMYNTFLPSDHVYCLWSMPGVVTYEWEVPKWPLTVVSGSQYDDRPIPHLIF